MPIHYERDDKKRRILTISEGEVTLDDTLAVIDRQVADGAWTYRMLFDTRASPSLPTLDELHQVVRHVGGAHHQVRPARSGRPGGRGSGALRDWRAIRAARRSDIAPRRAVRQSAGSRRVADGNGMRLGAGGWGWGARRRGWALDGPSGVERGQRFRSSAPSPSPAPTIEPWPAECATTASSGSRRERLTTAGRRPKRRSRRTSRRICRTPGNGCARPPSLLASSGSTPRTNRSCSRARSCYFFVRPKRDFLELNVFLGRALKAPQVRRIDRPSKSKVAHVIQIRHRDEVEAPITDWLQEAYEFCAVRAARAARRVPPSETDNLERGQKKPQAEAAGRAQETVAAVGSKRR